MLLVASSHIIPNINLSFILYPFVILPISIFTYNSDQFGTSYEAALFLIPFFVLALMFLTLSFLFYRRDNLPPILKRILIGAGLYLIFSDILAPVAMGELTGDDEQVRISEPLINILSEIFVFVFLLILVIFFKSIRMWKFLSLLSYVLIFVTLISSIIIYISKKHTSDKGIVRSNGNSIFKGNVYQIYLDAYSSYAFLPAAEANGNLKSFDDFIFYPKNRSNYDHTTPSSASFRLGNLNDQETKISEFIERSKSDGVAKDLYNSGFRVWNYVESASASNSFSFKVKTNDEVYRSKAGYNSKISLLRDFWSLRIIPTLWHKDLYYKGSGLFSRHFSGNRSIPIGEDARTYSSKLLLDEMIREENLRADSGEYVYIHSYITHGPYIFDANCNTRNARSAGKYSQKDYYLPQVICANKTIVEFIQKLKELDRFDNSLIFIHSDHGTWEIGPNEFTTSELDSRSEALLSETNLRRQSGRYMDNQTRALLLFKPPKTADKSLRGLQISEAGSQLLDIAPTIAEYIKSSTLRFEGLSLNNLTNVTNREIKITIGFKQVNKTGDSVTLSNEVSQLKFIEYKVRGDRYRLNDEYLANW